jgi:hypothetical protein
VFSSTATGNIAPASVISSPTSLPYPLAILLR